MVLYMLLVVIYGLNTPPGGACTLRGKNGIYLLTHYARKWFKAHRSLPGHEVSPNGRREVHQRDSIFYWNVEVQSQVISQLFVPLPYRLFSTPAEVLLNAPARRRQPCANITANPDVRPYTLRPTQCSITQSLCPQLVPISPHLIPPNRACGPSPTFADDLLSGSPEHGYVYTLSPTVVLYIAIHSIPIHPLVSIPNTTIDN